MAHRKLNAAQQIVTGTGTGALTLGAVTNAKFKTFQSAGLADGDNTYARIQHSTIDAEWECVKITRSGGTVTRTFDSKSVSATGALINFTSGDKIMGSALLADQAVTVDDAGNVNINGDLTVGGTVTGNTGGTDFAAAVQQAWDDDTGLNWLGGDVTLTSPILLQATTGKAAFSINGNGARINCDYNDSNVYAITMEVPPVSGSIPSGITVRNWVIKDLKFLYGGSDFGGAIEVRCLTNASWFYSFLMQDLSCDGHSDYGYFWNGSVFECIANRCKTTGGVGGFHIRRADFGGNNDFGLPSAMEMHSPNFRDGTGNGISLSCRVAFTEPFDLAVYDGYIVTMGGIGIDAPAGITKIDGTGVENCNGGWAFLIGYRGGAVKGGARGANAVAGADDSPPLGIRWLVEWWAATGALVLEDLNYTNEGPGTNMELAKFTGSGTVYLNRVGDGSDTSNSGCTVLFATYAP